MALDAYAPFIFLKIKKLRQDMQSEIWHGEIMPHGTTVSLYGAASN